SDMAVALRMARHVVTLSSWRLEADHRYPGPRVHRARDPHEAVALALRLAEAGPEPPASLADQPSLQDGVEKGRVVWHVEVAFSVDFPGPGDDLDRQNASTA